MKKNLATGLLALALTVGTLTVPAYALYDENLPEPKPGEMMITAIPENVTVAPALAMSRSGAVIRLWELSGKPQVNALLPFTDVEEGSEAAEAIRWAAAEGITSGYTDTFFGGDDAVTREQLAAMIYRFVQRYDMGFRGAWMFYLGCEDLKDVKEWAMEPMYWMVASRFYDGNEKLLRPQDKVTTAEADAIFAGLAEKAAQDSVDFTKPPVQE